MNGIERAPLRGAVLLAAGRPEVWGAVHALYADLAGEIERRRPVCVASGRCCRFEEYGHRLYVTTIELAAFWHDLDVEGLTDSAEKMMERAGRMMEEWDRGDLRGCPFQAGRLCGVHGVRPFGCRIFFCDASARQWQEEQYELFHRRMKDLHEGLGVAYFYVDWREGLRAVMGEGPESEARAG